MALLPEWHPHYDLWALLFFLGVGYWYANTRIRPVIAKAVPGPTRRQWQQWYLGLASMWLASGWPIHDIGEESLFTVHMIEHMLIALVVAPLLLLGLPRWLADITLGHPRVVRLTRALSRPFVAFAVFNLTFVTIHWPLVVESMLTNELVHFTIHAVLFVSAGMMWMPVVSPTPAIPKLVRPAQMLYLFLQSLLPTIPASFLTFSSAPIYPIYGDAALAWGMSAVTDQTVAGIVMKLGGGLLIWVTIAVIWFRWSAEERNWDELSVSVG